MIVISWGKLVAFFFDKRVFFGVSFESVFVRCVFRFVGIDLEIE